MTRHDVPVLFFVHATWCKYCTQTAPTIDRLEHALGSTVRIVRVDVDKQPGQAKSLGAASFPTILLKDGKGRMRKYEGERTFDKMVGWICDILDSCPTSVYGA